MSSKSLGRTTFYVSHPEGWYFRILGYGVSVKRGHTSFSERNGYRKPFLKLFGYRAFWLYRRELEPFL